MSFIYVPKGKAREYSPLALNHYIGCDHNCAYCYVKAIVPKHNNPRPRKNIITGLRKELSKTRIKDQVLLSFLGDPYCNLDSEMKITREVLSILNDNDVPVAILTKGGTRIYRDFDIIKRFSTIKVGSTLTFKNNADSEQWEPNAEKPENRMNMLKEAHEEGIKTFVSIEPVIDPIQSIQLIKDTISYVDQYKIGKWNHDKRSNLIDWQSFGEQSVKILRGKGKDFYIKNDLAVFLHNLTPAETDYNHLALKQKTNKNQQISLF